MRRVHRHRNMARYKEKVGVSVPGNRSKVHNENWPIEHESEVQLLLYLMDTAFRALPVSGAVHARSLAWCEMVDQSDHMVWLTCFLYE
eukprot:scaffold921_cov126-Cylindrotheca_fusiformis.AAC.12